MYTDENGEAKVGTIFLHIAITIVGIVLFFGSFGTVGAGEQGVLLRFGAVTGKIKDEGLYFKAPLIEKVVKKNVQIQKSEVPAASASRDLQSVSTTLAVNYQLRKDMVSSVYQDMRDEYQARVVDPAVQESIKNATAQFTAEELITKRSSVRDMIASNIKEKLESKGFVVYEVNIVNFDFSRTFNESIEKKVTAEQDALASKNKLEQVKYEAQQSIEAAKGKAEAIRIESDALRSNPAVLELRALEKWNGVLPTVTSGAVPFINVGNTK
jgi:regulator of protease activity HflC (stomatin/prohibitin superfamily)